MTDTNEIRQLTLIDRTEMFWAFVDNELLKEENDL